MKRTKFEAIGGREEGGGVVINEAGRFAGTLVKAGWIRAGDNSDTRLQVTSEAIRRAVDAGAFESVPCMIDHPNWDESPKLANMAGHWENTAWNEAEQSVDGELVLYGRNGQDMKVLFDEALKAAKPPDIGVSIVFYGASTEREGVVYLESIRHVQTADLVFMPAVRGAQLKRALSALEDDDMSKTTEAQEAPPIDFAPSLADEVMTMTAQAKGALAEVIQQSAVNLIDNSGLPDFVTIELKAQQWASIDEAKKAIKVEIDKQAAYSKLGAVNLPDGSRGEISGMKTPMDDAKELVNWLFGVKDAPLPEPAMRRAAAIYTAFTGDHDFHGVFQRSMFAGATTSDLPALAADAMNKVIIERWANLAHWRWYERVADVVAHDGTTHDLKLITYGGPGSLPTVAEKGAYTELDPGDGKETASFVKKGGYVGITLEMFQKSEIGRIQAVPKGLAAAAVRTRSAAVSALFTAASGVGPNLADTNPLFHASGSNVATTAFSEAAWKAARTECFKHVDGSGARIGINPRYALVPADLYDDALIVFGYGEGMPTTYKPYSEDRGFADLRAVPLAVPDWTDTNNWAYVTDPMEWPVIAMSYANQMGGGGHAMPELFSVTSETVGLMFTNDVMPIKIRDQFAVGVTGRAGIGKRNVA